MVAGAPVFVMLIAGMYSVYTWKEDERKTKRKANSSKPSTPKGLLKSKDEELNESTSFANERQKVECEGRGCEKTSGPGGRSVKDDELIGMTSVL